MPEHDPWAVAADVRAVDRWRAAAAGWGTDMTRALLDAADLRRDSRVLDVAAGSGDPAFSIARRLKAGNVVALDRAHSALLLAKRQAHDEGLESRLVFASADAQALPFADSCFDRVTCRCGIMFFNDVGRALAEIQRALRRGGHVAFLAWGPFEQPLFESTLGVVLRLVPGSSIPEAARAMVRFAVPGKIEAALRRAGFLNVRELHLTVTRIWAGSAEQLWEYQQEISTLFQPLFNGIPAAKRPLVDAAVCSALARHQDGDTINLPAQVVIATADR